MPNRCLGELSASIVVLSFFAAAPATAAARGAGEVCRVGTVRATIHVTSVCLSKGARCTTRYQSQYAKYGFLCGSGRLARTKTTPPPQSSGTTTTSPAGPFAGTWYA